MNQDYIKDLLDRYLKEETSAEENQLVERWFEGSLNPDPVWQKLDPLQKEQWLSTVFAAIKGTIDSNKPTLIEKKPRKYLWYKIAGAAAVLLISFSFYFGWPSLEDKVMPADLATISVGEHQKKQLILADGSKVWLNASAELRYPKSFSGKTREIYLVGEAYFDIQHDDSKPFLIHTGKITTTVLGTAFNIKEDQDKHTIEVTVTRGMVSVADEGQLLGVLTSNRQLSFNLVSRIPIEKIVDAKAVIAWQDPDILFDDITFADAALQLQEYFHVKIDFSNERLKNCRFSGKALNGDNMEKILKVICAFNNATWQTKPDGTIIIDGPGCN